MKNFFQKSLKYFLAGVMTAASLTAFIAHADVTNTFWTQTAANVLMTNTGNGLAGADIHVAHCYIGTGTSTSCGSGGGGGGTVTSVGLTVPTGFTVSGSPVTGSGTLGFTYTGGNGILQAIGGAFSPITIGTGLTFTGGTLSATQSPQLIGATSGIVTGSTPGGTSETFLGRFAGQNGSSTNSTVSLGFGAGQNAANNDKTVSIGFISGQNATNANTSIFIGNQTANSATDAAHSIFIGDSSGFHDTVDNTVSGHSILLGDNTSTGGFSDSIALGTSAVNTAANQIAWSTDYTAMYLPLNGGSLGDRLTNDGSGNATWQPDGSGGTVSVTAPITGDGSSGSPIGITQANGSTDGYLSSTDWNTFNNKQTLIGQTSGLISNPSPLSGTATFLGQGAGGTGASTTSTVFIGLNAGDSATAADNGTFIGIGAGGGATNANNSFFAGVNAGAGATTAGFSIFIGDAAGLNDTVNNTAMNGGTSILIGKNTSTGGFSNSIALGNNAINTATNQFLIGSTSIGGAAAINAITAPAYLNTRDDSGTTSPTNFLYTDADGKFLSAPTSFLGVPALNEFHLYVGDNTNHPVDGGANIVYNGTGLGINTASPAFPLDITAGVSGGYAAQITANASKTGILLNNILSGTFPGLTFGLSSSNDGIDPPSFQIWDETNAVPFFSYTPNSGVTFLNSGLQLKQTGWSGGTTHTITTDNYYNGVDTSGGATTLNLPPLSTSSQITIVVYDIASQAGTNNITIVPDGTDNISNVNAPYVINTNNGSVTLYADTGSMTWSVINSMAAAPSGGLIGQTAGIVSGGSPGFSSEAWLGVTAGASGASTSDTTFIGTGSGDTATNAAGSTFIGALAGANATNAANSIFLGFGAGGSDTVDNTVSGASILIGNNTSTGGFQNSIAIGTNAMNTVSNQFLVDPAYNIVSIGDATGSFYSDGDTTGFGDQTAGFKIQGTQSTGFFGIYFGSKQGFLFNVNGSGVETILGDNQSIAGPGGIFDYISTDSNTGYVTRSGAIQDSNVIIVPHNSSRTVVAGVDYDLEVHGGSSGAVTISLDTSNTPVGAVIIVSDTDALAATQNITIDAGSGNTINSATIAQTYVIGATQVGASVTLKLIDNTPGAYVWKVE